MGYDVSEGFNCHAGRGLLRGGFILWIILGVTSKMWDTQCTAQAVHRANQCVCVCACMRACVRACDVSVCIIKE